MRPAASPPQGPPEPGVPDPPEAPRPPNPTQPASEVARQAAWQRWVYERMRWRPLRSLWNLEGISIRELARRTWRSTWNDDLFGSAAEMGYWFLFALFPTLVSASSMVGIFARRAAENYDHLLRFAALVLPPSAYGFVYETYNEITAASSGSKVTFGLIVALWAASSGFSAIQDAMNAAYKIKESRPYWKARGAAFLIGTLLSLMLTAMLGVLLATDFFGRVVWLHFWHHTLAQSIIIVIRAVGWTIATVILSLIFAVIYYWAPDLKQRRWRWLTPGSAVGMVGWLLASAGLRVYLHFFNNYTETYGSLGAVIVMLTWFYLSGLMLLLGGEVNSEIEAAATERRLRAENPSAQ
ncbi:MAG TPA: YihY/virulence factor BrkB family protein [Acidobacteriaceae bacterium]|nr:YihY/virulence factor BrkB family protein [Acidobacteriaceae bacterium]